MANITLRLGRPADLNTVAAMSRDLIEMGLKWKWTPFRLNRLLSQKHAQLLIAESPSDEVAGFAIMEFHRNNAHMDLLAVAPAYRGLGLGRDMVIWLEETALAAGISRVILEVRAESTGARAFYQRLGYRQDAVLPGYYQGLETAIHMVHQLIRKTDNNVYWQHEIDALLARATKLPQE